MAKQIKQFRYYKEGNDNNWPDKLVMTSINLQTGKVFANYMPISQLSIQALPGTKFYLNNSHDPIVIGYTGIYQLTMNDLAEITSLKFDYQSIQDLNANEDTVLLIDIIYEKEEQ